jgi:hypothetical protein
MSESATLMIHDAWAFEAGDAETMQKTAETLDKLSETIANIYTNQIEKAGKLVDGDRDKTRELIRGMMKAEKWLNASEALELGLIDKIVANSPELEEIDMVGTQNSDADMKFRACLKSYKNTPNNILSKYQAKQTMEKDKKTLWQAFKAFFGAEIKAEIEAQKEPEAAEVEPTTIEDQKTEEMTIEEMKEALIKEGFEVSAKEVEQIEPAKEETTQAPQVDANAALMAEFKALKAEQDKLKEQLKAAKFEAAAKPAGGESKADDKGKKSVQMSAKNKAAFDNLAAILNNQ